MKIIPISKENHAKWSYVGLSNYLHTKTDAIVPILIAEINRVIFTNPIVFIENHKTLGLYSLQSLLPNVNLMIDSEGKWINNYIPARYRSLPFVLASETNQKKSDDKILCYIDELDCVSKSFKNKKSTPIFDSKLELSEDMNRVFEFLKSIEQNETITKKALESIYNAEIIEDWALSLKLQDGEKKMTGLKKVNLEKLKSLSSDKLHDLNVTGGLDICFANIFSLNNLEKLKQILISKSTNNQKKKADDNNNKSLRDLTLEKQNKEKKEEMDSLVKNLLLDDEI